MMRLRLLRFPIVVLLFITADSSAQRALDHPADYLWPTDASRNLTSVFCEYRGRRFHAGIDVKTWAKIGYRVFAVRPGYVWRISVSPFGYGKAIYIKLDTGEIAVYAHLSDFSERIRPVVEAEQRRRGKYSINLFLKRGVIPVAQGEVIAFTGQTGIGAPHLHFEIRDAANRPLNPLLKGYELPDQVRPVVTKVSISPLDGASEVNGDYRPVIFRPRWVRPGEYVIDEPISIWGNVGLAVSCYDKDSNSANRFGIYSLKLYVDGVLRFQYAYDQMLFKHNKMIELERDYRLARRGLGRFYKLYKDKNNVRSNYLPNRTWAGVLRSASLVTTPDLQTKSQKETDRSDFQTGSLFPGVHDFRIEVADFMGNASTVCGSIQVGAAFPFRPLISADENGMLNLTDLLTYDLTRIEKVEAFLLYRNRWREVVFDLPEDFPYLQEKGGQGAVSEIGDWSKPFLLRKPPTTPLIIKFVARDQFNTSSYPYIYFETQPNETSRPPELSISYDYYDDYLRLEVVSKNLLPEIPRLTLYPGRRDSLAVSLNQIDLKKYIGKIQYARLAGRYHLLRISTRNLNGDPFSIWENFAAQRIDPPQSKRLSSEDGNFWVEFAPGSLYGPIWGRVTVDSLIYAHDPKIGSKVYDAEPQDIPLSVGAKVVFRYYENEFNPEKLGVYYKTRRRWVFVDNEHDVTKRTVAAEVFSLEKFALIRDEEPPEISRIRPGYQVHLRNNTPFISVNVRDRLSGIESENDLVVRLNGTKLIAEYDPERHRIFYQVQEPLPKGRHELTVWAQDRSKNDAFERSVFWID